jgi:SAM-dependent methyltransferase
MSFSQEWDERFRENTHISVWPWSDLVSYVMRYARPIVPDSRVLELGCGAGANIPFFRSLGVQYYAVEGSAAITERLWKRFPDLGGNIMIGDFTENIPLSGQFDLIVDRGALTHNTTTAIKKALGLIHRKLNSTGRYIGIDWFSTVHSDYTKGTIMEGDEYTHFGYTEGALAHTGNVHFSDRQHLLDLFADFHIEIMEHKTVQREIPGDGFVFASWNLVAKKAGK